MEVDYKETVPGFLVRHDELGAQYCVYGGGSYWNASYRYPGAFHLHMDGVMFFDTAENAAAAMELLRGTFAKMLMTGESNLEVVKTIQRHKGRDPFYTLILESGRGWENTVNAIWHTSYPQW